MTQVFLAGESAPSSIISINGTFIVELISFLVMIAILGRFVYPPIEAAAQRRQKAISEALDSAEQNRAEAQARLEEANAKLEDARKQAQEVISGANRSADQIRNEAKGKADEEAAARLERARQDIEAARRQAIESVRAEVADMVITATERVTRQAIDAGAHRKLIDDAISEVRQAREAQAQGSASGRSR